MRGLQGHLDGCKGPRVGFDVQKWRGLHGPEKGFSGNLRFARFRTLSGAYIIMSAARGHGERAGRGA